MAKFEFYNGVIRIDDKKINYVTDMIIEVKPDGVAEVYLEIVLPINEVSVEHDDVNVDRMCSDLFPPKPNILTRFFRKLLS